MFGVNSQGQRCLGCGGWDGQIGLFVTIFFFKKAQGSFLTLLGVI